MRVRAKRAGIVNIARPLHASGHNFFHLFDTFLQFVENVDAFSLIQNQQISTIEAMKAESCNFME